MSTLHLKVLLNNVNRTIGLSTLIWFVTALAGTVVLAPTDVIGLPFYQILILSLAFSTPSFLVISPALLLTPCFPTRFSKFLFRLSIALAACLAVIAFFLFVTRDYPLDRNLKLAILAPYAGAALVFVPLALSYFNTNHLENKN